MAVRFRLPALMREAAAEFAATFILLVSKTGLLIYGESTTQQLYSLVHLKFYKMYFIKQEGKDNAVMRAFACHPCGLGWIPA